MDSSSSSLASSISSSSDWKYAVFLSFRGEDTRNNFTGHLYKALDQKGIETFMDDKKLRTGEEISPTLVTAIQRSRVQKNQKSEGLPIFYNVDPSHVRNQTGSFGEALAKHKENLKIKVEKVQKWREALTQVANLSGLHSVKNKYFQRFIFCTFERCPKPSGSGFLYKGTGIVIMSSVNGCSYGRNLGMGGIEHLASKGDDYLRKELLSKKLQDDKAIELFNHHAFINHPPTEDVMELSQRVIAYAQGLPLALEVLGSSLCKKSKDEWECALNKLEKNP
ncbi:TMV resistance protein N [Vitis vinifera]|uniref:TMV resistance protein N n=1 Tax=Vitis vinifera TaxID=29760 RepID=A0A438FH60_VITVI|nr:TMV resistance protein N [Vitis vinifera]